MTIKMERLNPEYASISDVSDLSNNVSNSLTNISNDIDSLAGSLATVEVSPAVANHAVGEYILYNNQLCKVTTAITAGESLSSSNTSPVSVGGELETHNATLTSLQNNKISCRMINAGAISVSANSYKDKTVSFTGFRSVMSVIPVLGTGSTAGGMGSTLPVLLSNTTTSANIRIFNHDSSTRAPTLFVNVFGIDN